MASKYVIGPLFQTDQPITQVYGARPEFYQQFNLPGHEGVDFGTPDGTPFLSPFNGIILRDTFNDKDYGNFTVVWDPVQLCGVWFCHLQDELTKPGDKVVRGQVLGHTNNTGNSSGPHCHVNFVETDTVGNRLNRGNPYQGFMNILDPVLVSIEGITPPVVPTVTVTGQIPEYLKTLLQENNLDLNNESQIREFFQKALDYPNQVNNYNDVSHKLAIANSDLVNVKQALGTLQTELHTLKNPGLDLSTPNVPSTDTGAKLETGFIGWLRRLFG